LRQEFSAVLSEQKASTACKAAMGCYDFCGMCGGEKSVQGGAGAANRLLREMLVAANCSILIDSARRLEIVATSSKQRVEAISNRQKNARTTRLQSALGTQLRNASGARQKNAPGTHQKNGMGERPWA